MAHWEISETDFLSACASVHGGADGGVGTLSEKTVHAVLKHCCAPFSDSREVQIGGFIADAVGEEGIIEIQTTGFYRMRKKLAVFLSACPVTVVWPCVETLWLRKLDPLTGEAGARRKSPRRQCPPMLFRELYSLGELVAEPGLRFKVVRLEAEELRSAEKVRGRKGHWPTYQKIDRYPIRLLGEVDVDCKEELWKLLPVRPEELPETVTAAEFGSLCGTGADLGRMTLKVLCRAGLAQEAGKKGRAVLYRLERNESSIKSPPLGENQKGMSIMPVMPSREEAWALLCQYNEEPFHRRHAVTVEGVMRWFADQLGYGDEKDFWGLVGLLHDLDFERWPEEHCIKVQELLTERDYDPKLIHGIVSHTGRIPGFAPEHQMEKVLFATDELTGLIGAVALMRPSKSVQDLEVKSVMKKFKTPKFAAGCSREVISEGAEMLGWELSDLIEKTILAMRSCEAEYEKY